MKPNKSQPILKVYFINNEYLSTCNICLYNIPKKEAKNGFYQYNFAFPKFKLKKDKYDVNVSISIPEDKFDTFLKYGIMQKNQLSYCEVIQNSNTHFSLSIWIYTCEQEIVGKKIRVREDRMNLTASINKHKKKQKKPTRKFVFVKSSSHCPAPTNFVSLSYVPKHKAQGGINPFRPYQGGSWAPR